MFTFLFNSLGPIAHICAHSVVFQFCHFVWCVCCKRNFDLTNARVYAGSKNKTGIKRGKYTNDLLKGVRSVLINWIEYTDYEL